MLFSCTQIMSFYHVSKLSLSAIRPAPNTKRLIFSSTLQGRWLWDVKCWPLCNPWIILWELSFWACSAKSCHYADEDIRTIGRFGKNFTRRLSLRITARKDLETRPWMFLDHIWRTERFLFTCSLFSPFRDCSVFISFANQFWYSNAAYNVSFALIS